MSNENNNSKKKGSGAAKFFFLTILLIILTNAITGATMYFVAKYSVVTTPVIRQDLVVDYDGKEDHIAKLAGVLKYNIVEIQTTGSLGTGIIMEYDGSGRPIIITNFHVISKEPFTADKVYRENEIGIRINGSLDFSGGIGALSLLGYDTHNDIAVIRLNKSVRQDGVDLYGKKDGDGNRQYIADSAKAVIGQRVFSLGNALGHGIAAGDGLISKPDAVIYTGSKAVSVIQTTAPINTGNSGGALFDMKGRLVGVNTYQTHKANDDFVDNISYAVPSDIAVAIYENIRNNPKDNVSDVTKRQASIFKAVMKGSDAASFKLEVSEKYSQGLDLSCFIDKTTVTAGDKEFHLFKVSNSQGLILKDGDLITEINGRRFLEYDSAGDPEFFDCNYSALIAELFKCTATGNSEDKIVIKVINGTALVRSMEIERTIPNYIVN